MGQPFAGTHLCFNDRGIVSFIVRILIDIILNYSEYVKYG